MHLPPVVTPNDWQTVRDELLVEEKEATRALDALAAKRRRLPMVRIDKEYVFEVPTARPTWSTSSRAAGSSSSTTSCSARAGSVPARAARRSPTTSATSPTSAPATP